MSSILTMLRKRYAPPRWVVVEEVADDTGTQAHRRADAFAIGIRPSDGYATHCFEYKASRSDLQKELSDPHKADAIGKFADHFWLVVDDLKIIDGIAIPKTWGVLYPRHQVLRVHQKAPERRSTPITRGFSAALLRKVTSSWVPLDEHRAMKASALEDARKEVERENARKRTEIERELEDLRSKLVAFTRDSGIDIEKLHHWELGEVAETVKTVIEARRHSGDGRRYRHSEAAALIRTEACGAKQASKRHASSSGHMASVAESLEQFAAKLEAEAEAATEPG